MNNEDSTDIEQFIEDWNDLTLWEKINFYLDFKHLVWKRRSKAFMLIIALLPGIVPVVSYILHH